MSAPVRTSGLPPTEYLAPEYVVSVEGQTLDPIVQGDLRELRVVSELNNLTSIEMLFNAWDETSFDLKHTDGSTFTLGNRVQVSLGYTDRVVSLAEGRIASLGAYFPEDGDPTLRVSALDDLWLLRDRKPVSGETKKFTELADWEIAQLVAQRNGITQTDFTQEGQRHSSVLQKNQADASFLLERALRRDFEAFITNDPAAGNNTLRFGPPLDGRDGVPLRVFVFKWGRDLLEFRPRISAAHQVSQLTVRGWDPQTKEAIVYTATSSDIPSGNGDSGPAALVSVGDKEEIKVDFPVTSTEEARDLAIALLRRRAYGFLTCAGRVIGLPDLRAGDSVEVQGVGRRFGGVYYLVKVEHNIGQNGYYSLFEARRLHDSGGEA